MAQYSNVRKLRKSLKKFGLGIYSRFNPAIGEYGFIVYDLASNCCVGGASPIEYCWSADDVREYLEELHS